MVGDHLDVDTIRNDFSLALESVELRLSELCEAELSAHEDLLSSWELEHRSSESCLCGLDVVGGGSDRDQDISNVYTCGLSVGFTKGSSHSLTESISTSAGKHLIDSNNVPWVHSCSQVESFFTCLVDHVFVRSNTGSF